MPVRGRSVFVGDFNQHHSLWGRHGRVSPGSSEMLEFTQRWSLSLAIPWGEVTWSSKEKRNSTIDHA